MSTHPGHGHEDVERYRNGSIEAKQLASPCEDKDLRDAYLAIAKNWSDLADRIECQLLRQG